jgi:hypothetical protein
LAKHSPTRGAAEDGLTVRRIEPRPDAQTFHQIGIGDEHPAEGDHVGMVQTARGQHKSQIITIVGNKGFGVGWIAPSLTASTPSARRQCQPSGEPDSFGSPSLFVDEASCRYFFRSYP